VDIERQYRSDGKNHFYLFGGGKEIKNNTSIHSSRYYSPGDSLDLNDDNNQILNNLYTPDYRYASRLRKCFFVRKNYYYETGEFFTRIFAVVCVIVSVIDDPQHLRHDLWLPTNQFANFSSGLGQSYPEKSSYLLPSHQVQ
jgi:hypothetical protein